MIYDMYSLPALALFVAACYSVSGSGVFEVTRRAVQGFHIDFTWRGADNNFIVILYNIIDPG